MLAALKSPALVRAAELSLPLCTTMAYRIAPIAASRLRWFATRAAEEAPMNEHFKLSQRPHPLNVLKYEQQEKEVSDRMGRQQNHIWSQDELEEKLKTYNDKHQPKTTMDHVMHTFMYYGLYHPFNLLTGYRHIDPTPTSIEWRLITLESVAGVPGFVAAGFRHFRSLRMLRKDYGWIGTLLEEAENERMHLLTCLKMFQAGPFTRTLVVTAQCTMTPLLMAIYFVQPKALHRLVGYLEQTACATYHNIITHIETPGTKLHTAWADLPAPDIAKGYWHLDDNAKWVDVLKCMYADECNHRDVNHTFADMSSDDPNPFVLKHKEDAARAWKLMQEENDKANARQGVASSPTH
eukprot:CAMPEP_0119410836 /NCGR_PEP_ID=MMETSP1335-20130426/3747_1 /TAXON_ID=259385 /ORGANISM="Chrysoculter rhomboideus, Strain RCC1486" /LENGTH=350 /DNA_ID=CAMNT_0007435421 /DNA_START=1 /DNA_END=1053 /DNA_ORIENTATION=+